MKHVFEKLGVISSYLDGFNATWIIGLGTKYGLFKLIAEANGDATIESLTKTCSADKQIIKAWCEAAYGFGLLDSDGNKINLADGVMEVLVDKNSQFNQAGFFEYALAASTNYWKFDRVLKGGPKVGFWEYDDKYVEGIHEGGKATYLSFANEIIPKNLKLRQVFQTKSQILEIGCGCGFGINILSDAYPECEFQGIDLDPRAINKAKEAVAQSPQKKNIFHIGDATDYLFDRKFDLILMLWVIHEINDPSVLLSKLRDDLNDNGQIFIMEVPYPSKPLTKKRNEVKSFCGLQLGEAIQGGSLMPPTRIINLLVSAGFSNVNHICFNDFLNAFQGGTN